MSVVSVVFCVSVLLHFFSFYVSVFLCVRVSCVSGIILVKMPRLIALCLCVFAFYQDVSRNDMMEEGFRWMGKWLGSGGCLVGRKEGRSC